MKIKNFLIGLAIMAILFIIVFVTHKNDVIRLLSGFKFWLNEHPAGPILVFLLIALTACPPLPGYSTMVIFTGFVYGMSGWFIASSAAIFGSSCVFLITRKFKIGFSMDRNWLTIAKVVEKKGLWFVLLLRLAPTPFNITNVVFAITKVKYATFALATSISSLKLLMHVYIGSAMGDHFEIKSEGPLLFLSIGLFVLASVVCYKAVQKEILLESRANEELLNVESGQV